MIYKINNIEYFKCIILVLIFIGWCLVWKLYLSKFKLVRELFSQQVPEVDSSSKTQKAQ